jgi:hypothetical protein
VCSDYIPIDAFEDEKAFLETYPMKCIEGLSDANSLLYGLSPEEIGDYKDSKETDSQLKSERVERNRS